MFDKYNMTKEENVFLAKRNIVDSMWKSANLEGIAITFPETQAIYDGMNIAKFRIDEIQTINNLKHAWKYLLITIDEKIDFKYISSINILVGSNLIESPGNLRIYEVAMGGTNWKPQMPSLELIEEIINPSEKFASDTDRIVTMMCKLMKLQAFNDGNKRTSMLIANHELIKNGKGIISVSQENKIEFGTKLIEHYEDENKIIELKEFIFDKCLNGIAK